MRAWHILICVVCVVQLDHYPVSTYLLPESSDTQFNLVKTIFLGKVFGKYSTYCLVYTIHTLQGDWYTIQYTHRPSIGLRHCERFYGLARALQIQYITVL